MNNNRTASRPPSPGVKWFILAVVFMLVLAAILFLSAGTLDWPMAWVFLAVFFACLLVNGVYLIRRNPGLLAERSEFKPRPGVEKWDVILSSTVRFAAPAALVLCGLDRRFGWSGQIPPAAQWTALMGGVLGFALILWTLASNPFAAVYVRIQSERGHTVTATGPYRFIRHPLYSGALVYLFSFPITLGSIWALGAGSLVGILLIGKTALEDRKLQRELEGYREYARRVRYRLLPGVW
jgi:protein-S-isoprenylcysteine O-methyltransferase Ste14